MVVDLFLVYQFIRKLVTPFNKWEAYKQGIIDEKGNILIRRRDFTKSSQKKAFGVFDQMILNIKKLLAKIPGGQSRLASYATALWLIREWNHFTDQTLLTEDVTDEQLEKSLQSFSDRYVNYIISEANVNSQSEKDENVTVGAGAIAGLGVGDQGEPGLTRAQQKKYKKKNLKSFKEVVRNKK